MTTPGETPVAPTRQIRIGLVGLGLIAQAIHIPRLQAEADRFAITHVCDLSPSLARAIADALPGSPRASTDAQAVFDDPNVDAVLILSAGTHAAASLAALQAGKHVLAEKPLCTTTAEADTLAAAAQQAGRVLQVGYMKMHDPLIAPARAALSTLGQPARVRMNILHPDHDLQTAHLSVLRFGDVDPSLIERARAAQAASVRDAVGDVPEGLTGLYGGVLLGSLVHQLSVLRALGVGLPTQIVYAESDSGSPAPGLSHVLVLGRLASGARLEISWNGLGAYPAYVEDTEVLAEAAGLRLRLASPYAPGPPPGLRVYRNGTSGRVSEDHEPIGPDGLHRQLIAFHEAIVAGGPVLADAAGAKADLECLQSIVAVVAARQGVTVGGEAGRSRSPVMVAGEA